MKIRIFLQNIFNSFKKNSSLKIKLQNKSQQVDEASIKTKNILPMIIDSSNKRKADAIPL